MGTTVPGLLCRTNVWGATLTSSGHDPKRWIVIQRTGADVDFDTRFLAIVVQIAEQPDCKGNDQNQ